MSTGTVRREIRGRGIPLPGNDVDTDRIIPARFLKSVTFEGLGTHVFEDARRQDSEHPFDQAAYQGAAILVVGQNFGCGSSREHAPLALKDWGIRAIVGGSFAEIFFGNCVANGMPCVTASMEDLAWLQRAIARDPSSTLSLDLERGEVRVGDRAVPVTMPATARSQLVSGTWNAAAVLLEAADRIEATAASLPYIRGF